MPEDRRPFAMRAPAPANEEDLPPANLDCITMGTTRMFRVRLYTPMPKLSVHFYTYVPQIQMHLSERNPSCTSVRVLVAFRSGVIKYSTHLGKLLLGIAPPNLQHYEFHQQIIEKFICREGLHIVSDKQCVV